MQEGLVYVPFYMRLDGRMTAKRKKKKTQALNKGEKLSLLNQAKPTKENVSSIMRTAKKRGSET